MSSRRPARTARSPASGDLAKRPQLNIRDGITRRRDVRHAASAPGRAAGGRTAAGRPARAPGRDPLQHGRQPAPAQRSDRRHRSSRLLEEPRGGHRLLHEPARHPERPRQRRNQGERGPRGRHPGGPAGGERRGVPVRARSISPAARSTTSSCASAPSSAACASTNTACSGPRRKRAIPPCSCRASTEEEIFQELGLHYIPPELRERPGNSRWRKRDPSRGCWNGPT